MLRAGVLPGCVCSGNRQGTQEEAAGGGGSTLAAGGRGDLPC